jgi:arsenate reductase
MPKSTTKSTTTKTSTTKTPMPKTDNITLIHNPKCSKSRQALALLVEHGVEANIFEYLSTPLTQTLLTDLKRALNIGDIRSMMRVNEAAYAEQRLDDPNLGENALATAIIANPILLQRPIVTNGRQAVIGRPPEKILSLITQQ